MNSDVACCAPSKELDCWIHQLERKIKLPEKSVQNLCIKVKEILQGEKNVLSLSTPISICGDIHGQFEDLMHLFEKRGIVSRVKYLFLGDYVDRGDHSVECISLLFAYKIKYRNNLYLTRGNHECRSITKVYGFYDECIRKYTDATVWKYFVDAFDYLPLCALIDDKILCMHGGLSINSLSLNHIHKIQRVQEVPSQGLMTDLLWSDPDDEIVVERSNRGAGIIFGPSVTKLFTHFNRLKYICRAHQVVHHGYQWSQEGLCLTIFSAANYCSSCGNSGAVMKLRHSNMTPTFFQYSGQTYPSTPGTGGSGSSLSSLTTFMT